MTGALRIIRDFLNTRDIEAGTDALAEPGGLARWLRSSGVGPGGAVPEREIDTARSIREGLRHVVVRHNGEASDPDCLAELNTVLADHLVRVYVGPNGELGWTAKETSGIGALVAVLAQAISDPDWVRLKVCRNEACRWAFFDASRNRSHKWCSMGACGNLMKARAYRSRKRASGG
jgi:predicted RNA-binding Zn ribbon-like protein